MYQVKIRSLLLWVALIFLIVSLVLYWGGKINKEERVNTEFLRLKSDNLNNSSKDEFEVDYKAIDYSTYQGWQKVLDSYNYYLEDDIINIPSIKITQFPDNLLQIKNVEQRKKLFIKIVLIAAYHVNQRLISDRRKLEDISNKYRICETISQSEEQWLQEKVEEYRVKGSFEEKINKLLYKVDVIPISLILAQAACESGWGTSRFAKVANNFFGEWTYDQHVAGVIPKERPVSADYRIKKFATVEDSFISYINNLNTNSAYQKLRNIRYRLRREGVQIDSFKLAEGLINYSERKEEYIEEIKEIIEYNRLKRFDKLLKVGNLND